MVRKRGYSLMEVSVAMAAFGIFLLILVVLTLEMRTQEKRFPVNFMKHPQVIAVLARMRRDVLDAWSSGKAGDPNEAYDIPDEVAADGYTSQDSNVLIVKTLADNGGLQTIVWDMRTPGRVLRRAYNVGVKTDWVANGVPQFSVEAVDLGGSRPWAVRVQAKDPKGRLAIDEILQPRVHQ